VLLALVASAAIAGFSMLASGAMGAGIARLPFLAVSFLAAAAALLPLAVTQPLGWLLEPPAVLLALHLGVVTMAVANVAYARGLAALGPGPTGTLLLGGAGRRARAGGRRPAGAAGRAGGSPARCSSGARWVSRCWPPGAPLRQIPVPTQTGQLCR
jgi:hypothetical protein